MAKSYRYKYMKKISILGMGWLGLSLVKTFAKNDFYVKGSTAKVKKNLNLFNATEYLIDIDKLVLNASDFLDSEILIINIPSKNITSFEKLLKEINMSSIKKVLFISSTSVYANTNKIIKESDEDSYCDSPLLKIEKLFLDSTSFKTTILRFGGLIGYDRNPANFFRDKKEVKNASSFINLIHRDDCVSIIEKIVYKEVWNEVFNACADTHPTKREFYTLACVNAGVKLPKFIDNKEESYKIISNEKVKRFLKYSFRY